MELHSQKPKGRGDPLIQCFRLFNWHHCNIERITSDMIQHRMLGNENETIRGTMTKQPTSNRINVIETQMV